MAVDNSSDGQQGAGNTGSSGSQQGGGGAAGQVNNPNLSGSGGASVVDLTDDSMVRLPGAKDPVRYGDHYRGFQSEFTKRAQEASTLRAEKAKLTAQLVDYQRRLQQGQQGQQGQQAPESKLASLAGQLKSLTYLSGEQAANVVDNVMQEMKAAAGELQRRDVALALMFKKMQ